MCVCFFQKPQNKNHLTWKWSRNRQKWWQFYWKIWPSCSEQVWTARPSFSWDGDLQHGQWLEPAAFHVPCSQGRAGCLVSAVSAVWNWGQAKRFGPVPRPVCCCSHVLPVEVKSSDPSKACLYLLSIFVPLLLIHLLYLNCGTKGSRFFWCYEDKQEHWAWIDLCGVV